LSAGGYQESGNSGCQRGTANGEKVAAAERELGSVVAGVTPDAMQPATADAAIALALEKFGGFHGLYHVAGGSGRRQGDGRKK